MDAFASLHGNEIPGNVTTPTEKLLANKIDGCVRFNLLKPA